MEAGASTRRSARRDTDVTSIFSRSSKPSSTRSAAVRMGPAGTWAHPLWPNPPMSTAHQTPRIKALRRQRPFFTGAEHLTWLTWFIPALPGDSQVDYTLGRQRRATAIRSVIEVWLAARGGNGADATAMHSNLEAQSKKVQREGRH